MSRDAEKVAAIADEQLLVLGDRSRHHKHQLVVNGDSGDVGRARVVEERSEREDSGADLLPRPADAERVRDDDFHLLSHELLEECSIFGVFRNRLHQLDVLLHQRLHSVWQLISLQAIYRHQKILLPEIFVASRQVEVENCLRRRLVLEKLLELLDLRKNPDRLEDHSVVHLENAALLVQLKVHVMALELVKTSSDSHAGLRAEHC